MPVSLLAGGFFTFRADTAENNIVSGKIKSVCVFDVLLQAANILHINIENPSAPLASHMAVIVREVVKAISAAGYLQFSYLAHIGKQIEISVYGRAAYVGMRFDDLIVYLVGGGVAMQLVYSFQNQRALYGITVHICNPYCISVFNSIIYQ